MPGGPEGEHVPSEEEQKVIDVQMSEGSDEKKASEEREQLDNLFAEVAERAKENKSYEFLSKLKSWQMLYRNSDFREKLLDKREDGYEDVLWDQKKLMEELKKAGTTEEVDGIFSHLTQKVQDSLWLNLHREVDRTYKGDQLVGVALTHFGEGSLRANTLNRFIEGCSATPSTVESFLAGKSENEYYLEKEREKDNL